MLGRADEFDRIGAALRRPDLAGMLLCGPTGVGKSTLLDAAVAAAEAEGFEAVRLHPSRASSAVPLVVFSDLLGSDDVDASAECFVAIRSALLARSLDRPLLIAVDDAHELDDASAGLVAQLARELTAFMVGTVRTSEPLPGPIAALWTQGLAIRIDVGPLSRDATAEVAATVLGSVVDPALAAELWRRTAGNPLHIRELLAGSRIAASIDLVEGVWVRTGDLVASDALVDLVAVRIDARSSDEKLALCAVALAEPAGVALIEELAGPDVLVGLEEAGLVDIHVDRRRLVVRLTHPIYGEAIRAATSTLRARQLRRDLSRAVTAYGTRRTDDALHVAAWRLDAVDPDPVLFAQAAFEAIRRHDLDLAERLASSAHDEHPGSLAVRALAMTRHLLGRHDAALAVLDAALAAPDLPAADVARIHLLEGLVLARGLGDYEAAVAALEAVDDAHAGSKSRAVAMLALIRLLRGHAARGVVDAERLVDEGAAGAGETEAITALVGCLAATGRPAEAMRIADGHIARVGQPDARSLFPDFRYVALLEAGRAREMEREVSDAWETSVDGGDRHRQARLALAMGHVQTDMARFREGCAWFERAAALSQSVGERFGVRWALCGTLLAAAQMGDMEAVDAATAGLASIPGHPAQFFEIYGRRGAAWASFARGHTSQACADLLALADELHADGCTSQAVRTLVDAARLGEPRNAQRSLEAMAPEIDGDLLPTCVAFIAALAEGNVDGLADASTTFEQLGYGALALGAAGAAHEALVLAGGGREATAWARQVELMTAESGPVTGLVLTAAEPLVPLTRREREIAHLVAGGRTSRQVAEELFLSVRTVDNHLGRAYDKLGVRNRADLADALRPLAVGDPG